LTGLFLSRAGSLTVGQLDKSKLLSHVQLMKPAKVAPIVSCEARYGGAVDPAPIE